MVHIYVKRQGQQVKSLEKQLVNTDLIEKLLLEGGLLGGVLSGRRGRTLLPRRAAFSGRRGRRGLARLDLGCAQGL